MSVYRRRYGVLPRRRGLVPPSSRRYHINDGGQDAPMGPKDQALFRDLFWIFLLVVVLLFVVAKIG